LRPSTACCRCGARRRRLFLQDCGRRSPDDEERTRAGLLAAYRWQYIVSGVEEPRFQDILGSMITEDQAARIGNALAPIM
jgi:hypothetical protein